MTLTCALPKRGEIRARPFHGGKTPQGQVAVTYEGSLNTRVIDAAYRTMMHKSKAAAF